MNHSYPAHPKSKSGFALISVLALVSLAALTATAFLASARLERQATRPIGETTRLQMTLNTGRECASEVINRVGEPKWNFVTTYWRTNSADELGYLFVGKPYGASSLRWDFYCGFTPAQWTNLDSADMNTRIRATNTICQATYSTDMQTFMASATSGFSVSPGLTNPTCVQIPLLGGRTSPTVGWVYIKQDIRTNLSSTNTSNLPVARFAYFTEDLGGLIDADRMCGTNTRNTGTNAEEISLANLVGSSATNIAPTTLTNKRPQYLTPGMLLATNGGVLTDTNDLRYFASRLRYCNWNGVNSNWDRIPYVPISSTPVNGSYYPSQAGQRKTNLSDNNLLNAGGATKIAATINNNYPMFTNRAGGMNGTDYVNAIAANIVDYADSDSLPTTVGGSVGWDAYPLPTQIFDQMVWNKTAKTLTVTTYLQLWNQSTRTSPAVTYTFNNNFQDTYADGTRIQPTAWTTNIAVPKLDPNQGIILSIPMPVIANLDITKIGTSGNFPINGSSAQFFTNTFSLTLSSYLIASMKTKYERKAKTLQDGIPEWSGCLPTLRYDSLSPNVLTTGDPRMLNYITNATTPVSAVNYEGNSVWASYGQTRTASLGFSDRWNADPRNWPDGIISTNYPVTGQQPTNVNSPPTNGTFSPPGVALCKLSNTDFTNITELGNIFDPMQWAPSSTATINKQYDYVNCDISPAPAWNANRMYGGGQTLRIGRPEHSRFAFTNLGGNYTVPSLGTSAAGLMDLFCATNVYNWAGKININTAPPAVLAALAGGITLSKDTNKVGSEDNTNMISAFTNGVIKFRSLYPFITPSQLSFISTNYGATGWTNSANWKANAVFSTTTALSGVTSLNDQGREEWFSKIYNLTCVQSFNYRIYVVAQLTDTNGNPKGAMMRKYYQLHLRYNQPQPSATEPSNRDKDTPSVSPVVTYEAFY